MKQLHELQIKILEGLLFSNGARYSELKPLTAENSKFSFHLNMLLSQELVHKSKNVYKLTDQGKEYANRITSENMKIERQAKVTTILCAYKKISGTTKYLLYKRLKNPFFGCIGFPTEKPKWGEKLIATAKRGLKEEANLEGNPKLFAIRHYLVKSKDVLVEDKLMHAFLFENPEGKLENNMEGNYFWIDEKNIPKKVKRLLEEFDEILTTLKQFKGEVTFKEILINTKRF